MQASEKTILIVDDEEDIRELVEITLEDSRYHLCTAADGQAALTVIPYHQPDLVILDWAMPRLNGLEVLKSLRQDPATAHIPVVLLTSRDPHDSVEDFGALGLFSYLRKPFSPLELLQTVEEALAG